MDVTSLSFLEEGWPHAIQRSDYLAMLIDTLYGIRHNQIILTKRGFA